MVFEAESVISFSVIMLSSAMNVLFDVKNDE